jgi:hypothetical protein
VQPPKKVLGTCTGGSARRGEPTAASPTQCVWDNAFHLFSLGDFLIQNPRRRIRTSKGIYSRLTAALPVKEAAVIRRIALVSFLIVIGCNTWAEPSPAPNHITSRIPRQSVQSTAIAKVGYSKRRHILEIEFVNGAVYRYFDIPLSVYRDLMSAESKARFYDSNIRKHYRSVLVRPRQKEQH